MPAKRSSTILVLLEDVRLSDKGMSPCRLGCSSVNRCSKLSSLQKILLSWRRPSNEEQSEQAERAREGEGEREEKQKKKKCTGRLGVG
jgi:hypothetical protein